MNPTETAAIILTGVFFMAMVAIAVQTAENQRRERQLILLAMRNRIRGTEHLLDNMPPEFMTQMLRGLLIHALKALWVRATKLDKSINTPAHIQTLEEREKEPITPPPFPANQVTLFLDRNTAQRNRSLVREAAQLIFELKKQNAISYDDAQQQLFHLKISYQRCNCDLLLHEAQAIMTDRGAKIAIHKFKAVTVQLKKLNHNHQVDSQLDQLQQLIQSLDNSPQSLSSPVIS